MLTKDNNVFVVDKNNKVHKREIKIERNNGENHCEKVEIWR